MQILDVLEGRLLVATDIQGNWEDYQAITHKFKRLQQEGKVDILVFAGDLIHGYPGYEDKSKEILDDLLGDSDPSVVCLLGNHELMHIYHLDVKKGDLSFAKHLEDRIEAERERYVGLFKGMPYAIRTAGGVTINHTGANPPFGGMYRPEYERPAQQSLRTLLTLDHDHFLAFLKERTKKHLEEEYGCVLDPEFFADFTPQLGETFMGVDVGAFLWDVFFNKNELQFKKAYEEVLLPRFLERMSTPEKPQQFLISGHIPVAEGYQVIGERQLRISSSYGAEQGKKTLALVDVARKYTQMQELIDDLVAL